MAVHCGVCARRLGSAAENDGSFSTSIFSGWDTDGAGGAAKIRDTCEVCGSILRMAVAEAAEQIAQRHQPAIVKLRKEIQEQREHEERLRKEKQAFEAEWSERKRKL